MTRLVLLLSVALMTWSCQTSAQTEYRLSPVAFEEKLQDKTVQILDVRTAGEFKSGYIDQAMQANWLDKKEFEERTRHLDKSRPVMIYCASGVRSAEAADLLRSNGYKVYELTGGLNKWKREGKKVAGEKSTSQMSTSEYQQLISQPGLVLVDFGASWCPPCRKMEPVLAQLQTELEGKFSLQKIDGGINTDVMKYMKVEGLPHFFVYKDGKQLWQKQGLVSLDELKQVLQ